MNIYVSNLAGNTTEGELKELFRQHGEVSSVKIITDYNTGQSRGFAFVEMPDDNDGQKAIEKLSGASVNNNSISVQVARPKEDRPKSNSFPKNDKFRRY